jgi:signal recognition particle GTPase
MHKIKGSGRRKEMISLDLRSRKPIYEQLVEKLKELIIHEVFKADEKLPSVRFLSKELTVRIQSKKHIESLNIKDIFILFQVKGVLLFHKLLQQTMRRWKK